MVREDWRGAAGARLPARDRSPEWQAVYQSHQCSETRSDETEDSQTDEGGRVVEDRTAEFGPQASEALHSECLNPSISFSVALHASLSLAWKNWQKPVFGCNWW